MHVRSKNARKLNCRLIYGRLKLSLTIDGEHLNPCTEHQKFKTRVASDSCVSKYPNRLMYLSSKILICLCYKSEIYDVRLLL